MPKAKAAEAKPDFLTRVQLCERLQVSRPTIDRMIEAGEFGGVVKLSGNTKCAHVRISVKGYLDYCERNGVEVER